MRDAIKASGAPVVAVSPIIGGQAVKGPTAKMMRELGLEASAAGVAARYGDVLDGYIVDHPDADGIGSISARGTIAQTPMTSPQDRGTPARAPREAGGAEGARDGHTGSVNAGRRLLAGEGHCGMITMPGDIPATRAGEIDAVLSAHLAAPSFTISPAHDDLGSNAVVCSPPESVPLRFGDN